jgi:hypothetical protein
MPSAATREPRDAPAHAATAKELPCLPARPVTATATAIFADLTIDQINDLDLSYSPPFGAPSDAPRSTSRRRQQAGTNIRIDSGIAGAL